MNPPSMEGIASPLLMTLMVAGAVAHSLRAARRLSQPWKFPAVKAGIFGSIHVLIAGVFWRHFIKDGWLVQHYSWNDADNINLVIAIFEALAAAVVAVMALTRKPFAYKLALDFLVIQAALGVFFLTLVLIFVFTWHATML